MDIKYLAAAILAAAVSSSAYAEEKMNEISAFVYANKQITPSGQDPMVTIYASYGKYIRERIAITGSASITKAGGTNMGSVGFGGKYYFKVGQRGELVPFVNAELQLGHGSGTGYTQNFYNLAGGGGASYFITETASVDGRIVYQIGSASTTVNVFGGQATSSQSTSSIMLTAGLTQRF